MSHLRYALLLIASVLGTAAALAAGSAELQPLTGDLARIGRFEQAEFGWNAPQARFERPLFDVEPARLEHDIVILGDSFSQDGEAGWPNYLAAWTGLRVSSRHLGRTSWRGLLEEPGYRASPPSLLILQIVERDLRKWLGGEGADCGGGVPAPAPRLTASPRPLPLSDVARPTRRGLRQLDPLEFVQHHKARLLRGLGRSGGEAFEARLSRPAFSSRRADSALFYAGDRLKAHWTAEDVRRLGCAIRSIQDEAQRGGRTLFLAMLVPDKLSAYDGLLMDPSLRGLSVLPRLERAGYQRVPVRERLAHLIERGALDVYLPDDTHLGAAGHRAAAEAVLEALRRRGVLVTAAAQLSTAN